MAAIAAVMMTAAACSGGGGGSPDGTADVARGRELFQNNCATCHGQDLQGTATGPPLIHQLYVPSHHSDASFLAAVQRGVQPHHWQFGPMPPVPSLDEQDVADIVAYVREQQREAGLID